MQHIIQVDNTLWALINRLQGKAYDAILIQAAGIHRPPEYSAKNGPASGFRSCIWIRIAPASTLNCQRE